ncbi:sensory box protein [Paraburkholderia xenovorans LB400]|uniref:PAS/PAC sensor protein n=1 Tax=Paraburkholderia xenovorans (strain LB400) TaxID=266265 RepID=Q13JC7_PARXL|nr:PAS domain S-box protein [Paraburkholderia xenovorans]ABE35812.1 Putative PAS/PAC sensor protein [Paraburkholderia xenovorans LB400]AIP36529.1 sensory box protein [Paraburkholderia xenovorans LB400]
MFQKNLKIGTLLGLGFIAVIVLLIALGASSLHAVSSEYDYVLQSRDKWARRIQIGLQIQATLYLMQVHEYRIAAATTPSEIEATTVSLGRVMAAYQREAAHYKRLDPSPPPEEEATWSDMQRLMSMYMYIVNDRWISSDTNIRNEITSGVDGSSARTLKQIVDDAQRLVDLNLEDGKRQQLAAQRVYSRAAIFVGALIAAAIAIAAALVLIIRRGLLTQLGGEPRDLVVLASGIANGNLQVEFELKPGDQTSLKWALRIMRDQLVAVLKENKDAAFRYRALYERTPVMLFSVDQNGRLRNVSDQWLATTGYGREEVLGRYVGDFYMPGEGNPTRQALTDLLHTGRISDVERRVACKDGSRIDVLLSASATRDPDGNLVSLSSWQDVTERNRIKAELVSGRERLRVTLDSIGDGVIAIDHHGRVEYLNPAAETLTGWRGEQARGLPLDKVFCRASNKMRAARQSG